MCASAKQQLHTNIQNCFENRVTDSCIDFSETGLSPHSSTLPMQRLRPRARHPALLHRSHGTSFQQLHPGMRRPLPAVRVCCLWSSGVPTSLEPTSSGQVWRQLTMACRTAQQQRRLCAV